MGFFPNFVFPSLPSLTGMPVICTDWILETADPLLAVQLLLWLGWKATPGAHSYTATSLCSAEFMPCLLCCVVRNAGRALRLPSAALLEQHRAHASPKRTPNAARYDLAAATCPSLPHSQHKGSAPLLSPGIRLLGWQCAHLGFSQEVLLGGLCVHGKELMLPAEQLCWPQQDTQT